MATVVPIVIATGRAGGTAIVIKSSARITIVVTVALIFIYCLFFIIFCFLLFTSSPLFLLLGKTNGSEYFKPPK